MRSLEDERICALEPRPSRYPALAVLQILAGLAQIIGGVGPRSAGPEVSLVARRASKVMAACAAVALFVLYLTWRGHC
jgi:hypothetical protein